MKLALKYGLSITAVVVLWIVVVRLGLGVGPGAGGPIIFNVTAIVAIFLGIMRTKSEAHGQLSFKQGLKTGVGISFVYAASSCLFFAIEYLVAGPRLLLSEMGPQDRPLSQVAGIAYAGMFFGSLVFGLIYSTLISFFLAKRQSAN